MSRSYYFLCASLPTLQFGAHPLMDTPVFLAECEKQLTPALQTQLVELSLLPRAKASCGAEAEWNAWETTLRNHLARLRAVRAGVDATPWIMDPATLPASTSGLEKFVSESFTNRQPQATEELLDRRRWHLLDELETGRVFSYDILVIYRLKLLILEKWRGYSVPLGQQALKTFLDTKLKSFKLPEFADAS